ncbi:MAG TPA: hypothetical protein EYH08_06065 [Pyrodictium sp.]|nr:hypothetical protein [Pyrodictium sp.]
MPGPWWRGGWKWIDVPSPWPGRGPWRFLPPWLRPGWLFGGRGRCWLYLYLLYYHPYLIPYLAAWWSWYLAPLYMLAYWFRPYWW